MAFSDQNRTLKKNHEAVQRPTTRCWFLLDYSQPHYQIRSWAIVFPSSFMINFRIEYVWLIYQSLDKRIWFAILFFISKWVALFQIMIFFAKLWLILSQLELSRTKLPKMYPKYFNGKLWPYHLSCCMNSSLYDPACKARLFEKFILELEASYSFKITCKAGNICKENW